MIRNFRHRRRPLRRITRRRLRQLRRLDRRRRLLNRHRPVHHRLPITRLPIIRFLGLRFRNLHQRFRLVPPLIQRLNQWPNLLEHRIRLHQNLRRQPAVLQSLRRLNQLIRSHYRHHHPLNRRFPTLHPRLVLRLFQSFLRTSRRHLRLPRKRRRQLRRRQRTHRLLRVPILLHPLIHFPCRYPLRLRRPLQFLRPNIQGRFRNLIQLLLHLRIVRQLCLQLLNQFLRGLQRHLRQHLRLRKFFVQLLLDSQLLLLFPQRQSRLLKILPLLQGRIMSPNFLQSLRRQLLLLHRLIIVRLHLPLIQPRRHLQQRRRRRSRWLFQHRQRIVRIPHPLPLPLLQNVLLVRIRTNQILQSLNFPVNPLLPHQLRTRLHFRFLHLPTTHFPRRLIRILLHSQFFRRQRQSQFTDARRQFQ